MSELRRRELIGSPVTIADYDAVLERMAAAVTDDERIYICCAPASTYVTARSDAGLRAALEDAAVVTPDGMGVVWAARLMGEQLRDRVYGPTLMARHCEHAATDGTRIWLYGGFDDAALAQLRDALARRFPGLTIAGGWSPPHRPLVEAELEEMAGTINADAPDVVWVGFGSPKQEKWMRAMRSRLDAPVLVGVGAAFDFHAGRVPQAPAWMQKNGLEWFFRMLKEPRRLGPRYLRTNPVFIWQVTRQAVQERGARHRTSTH